MRQYLAKQKDSNNFFIDNISHILHTSYYCTLVHHISYLWWYLVWFVFHCPSVLSASFAYHFSEMRASSYCSSLQTASSGFWAANAVVCIKITTSIRASRVLGKMTRVTIVTRVCMDYQLNENQGVSNDSSHQSLFTPWSHSRFFMSHVFSCPIFCATSWIQSLPVLLLMLLPRETTLAWHMKMTTVVSWSKMHLKPFLKRS